MEYVLVNDDCNGCQYVSNAFTLLKLPLRIVAIDFDAESIANTSVIIVCKHLENQHKNKIADVVNTHSASIISFGDVNKKHAYTDRYIRFLPLPFSKYELRDALLQCTNHYINSAEQPGFHSTMFDKLVGQGPQITKVKSVIKQVAYSDTTVLILGQSGTGKDVVASCIHQLSERRANPFIPINCGAIPAELMESELFGHEKGAFTGAMARRAGRFEMADTGSLFLDEIGDMPLPMQVKLLRVIQDRKIDRVGGNSSLDVNVRIIAATHKNLEELIQQHHFREDLYYRINVFPIYVPSLHERSEDIPLLIDYNLEKIQQRLKHRVEFTDSAKEILCNYTWPGNIRELQNFLERMVILYPDRIVDAKDLDGLYKKKTAASILTLPQGAAINIKEYISEVEQQVIKVALERSNGAINAAASYLSLGRATLLEKMKKYNLMVADAST